MGRCLRGGPRLAGSQTAKDLLSEQRSSIAFKEKSCTFYANREHRRERQMLSFPACRGQVIEERTKHLDAICEDLAPH